ncbi:MAG: glycosyltransferase family 4 protein [Candidatus Peribacteraceae bacterium]|nr:glycosyltransferase family 4 protein [Candidatus Peribacteraceae bacterium]
MRITYVFHGRFPTEKAHGHQVAQVCTALSRLGHAVTIVAPTVANNIAADPRAYYGLPSDVCVERLRHSDGFSLPLVPGFLKYAVTLLGYRRALRSYLGHHPSDLLYLRSPYLLRTVLRATTPVLLELHDLPRRKRAAFARLCNRCTRIVCLTTPLRKELIERGVHPSRIIVEGDAVDLRRFEQTPPSPAPLPPDELPKVPVIGYVGSLVTRDTLEKGVRELLQACALLTKRGMSFRVKITGGPQRWVEAYRALAKDFGIASLVHFDGPVPSADVPAAIAACNVCVYPAPGTNHPYFRRDTSPLKVFEYLAAGRPIVCADLPPLRDVLSEETAVFCPPGDPAALADALEKVLRDPSLATSLAARGKELVRHHTWEERMKRVLSF